MPKKKSRKENQNKRNEIMGVVLILIGILLMISMLINTESVIKTFIADGFMRGTFGIGAYVIPLLLMFFGVYKIVSKSAEENTVKSVMWVIMTLALMGLVHICFGWFMPEKLDIATNFGEAIVDAYLLGKENIGVGGFTEFYVYFIAWLFSDIGAFFVFLALIVISLIVLFNLSLRDTGEKVSEKVKNTGEKVKESFEQASLKIKEKKKKVYDYDIGEDEEDMRDVIVIEPNEEIKIPKKINVTEKEELPPRRKPFIKEYDDFGEEEFDKDAEFDHKIDEYIEESEDKENSEVYEVPPLNLLNAPQTPKRSATDHSEKIEMMESTLKSFGINAWVENITIGPAITRYELSIERGTRVSKILNLSDDIALSMAATNVRIEAPIPGKSAIGIEIPNESVAMVTLREVLEAVAFKEHKSPVAVGLGKDITGNTIVADLSKMPHLLIAGQTGAGKSVCINSIITSLLYKSSPKDVKLILIDPKMVELNVYNGIPHLMTPVVTDPKKAAGALQFVVREMEKRYETFAKRKVKDINRYNEVVEEAGEEKMPRIVVIVDELNDLMLVARGEVEDSVMRIAQLARAAGIYLILATQRPSVNVITGVIKANIPSRIAFAVASGVDSKTILDATGAEKLVGKGDMLLKR